jgi:hypothetical protein
MWSGFRYRWVYFVQKIHLIYGCILAQLSIWSTGQSQQHAKQIFLLYLIHFSTSALQQIIKFQHSKSVDGGLYPSNPHSRQLMLQRGPDADQGLYQTNYAMIATPIERKT